MATKVKPTRLQITGTPQAGQVPIYVNPDCFCWGSSGCQGTVIGPSSSCDGDIPLFCGTCGDCIIDSGEKLCDYAKCCDIPTDNCQLANGCGYQTTSCMVNDFSSPNCTTYPTTEAVCCYVGQKISGAYIYKGTVNTYEDLPTTGLTAGDVYNVTTAHTTSPEFPAGANVAWTGSSWDVLGGVFDLSCKQDVLTAGPNITLSGATISGDFNYATSSTAATCTTKCVCIPEITQLCVGQQITVMPKITATNCATSLKLNDFTAYPIRYNNAALTSTTDGYVRGADCLSTFIFDGSYWHVVSKSYDVNTTYTMNYSVDAGKYKAGNGNYAISRYVLAMEKGDGTWEKIVATNANYSTGTSKGVNTNGFRLGHIRYYNTTTVVANGALIGTNTMSNKAASVDLRYSTNCGGVTNWLEGDYMYIVGTMGNDGLFYLDTTTRWSNKLPTTNDGKLYIRIGICLAAGGYTCSLLDYRPIYYYDNGIKEYKVADNKQDTLVSGTNIKTINGCDLLGSGDICICGGGGGDMEKCVYDPCGCNADAFDYCNFHNTPTIPTDNCELANGCGYQYVCNMVCDLTGADNTHYPTAKAVADAIQGAGGGDMMKSTYDPCNCNDDAFDYCNFHNTPTIPTDNCQLANGCGYTTCTGTVSTCLDVITALGYTPYSTGNPCNYINNFAGVISALGYTPYNNTNPCGFTTCTGTVVASDLTSYAKSCDLCTVATTGKYCDLTGQPTIPTDNCQLDNGCGYTTCTGTLTSADIVGFVQESCIACVNGCCLTQGGDICISGGSGIQNDTTGTTDVIDCIWSGTKAEFNLITPDSDNYYIVTDAGSPQSLCCCDVVNALGYTPIQDCQIATINGCCLTQGGNICIQGGGGGAYSLDFLLVGGGGNCGCTYNCQVGGGGGGGGVVECFGFCTSDSSFNITIGCGGTGYLEAGNGGDTIFCSQGYCCAAIGGGRGGGRSCTIGPGCSGGSGGGGGGNSCGQKYLGGYGKQGQGYHGGVGINSTSCNQKTGGGGGGGAGGPGCNAYASTNITYAGNGGYGIMSEISYNPNVEYGAGGDGTSCCGPYYPKRTGCKSYGAGGEIGTTGCQGVVYIRYKDDGSSGFSCATGGNVCCHCGCYCIHEFTTNGIFCIIN